MARLVGVDLPREKRVEIALTYIFGMGLTRSHETLKATGISPDTRVKDLQESELAQLREYIEANYKIEGDLRREVSMNIKRLMDLGTWRGMRHRKGLPVRGQRGRVRHDIDEIGEAVHDHQLVEADAGGVAGACAGAGKREPGAR